MQSVVPGLRKYAAVDVRQTCAKYRQVADHHAAMIGAERVCRAAELLPRGVRRFYGLKHDDTVLHVAVEPVRL